MVKVKNKYGTIKIIIRWFHQLSNIIDLWRMFLCYATVMTLLSVILNRWTYTCKGITSGYWCDWYGNAPHWALATFITWNVATFYLLSAFSYDFYKGMTQKTTYNFKELFSVNKQKLKSVGMFLSCLAMIVIPCAIVIYIINPMQFSAWHMVNTDWRIELIFFTIAFLCMMIPLLLMRCSAGIAYYFNEGRIPYKALYKMTTRRAYVGIFGFMLLVLICINIHLNLIRDLSKFAFDYNYMSVGIITEFIHSFAILIYFALFLLLFQAEYLQLKEKEAAEMQNTPQDIVENTDCTTEAEDILPPKGKTKKSAKKKKSQRKAKTAQNTKKENKK